MLLKEMKQQSKLYFVNGMYRVQVANKRINSFFRLKDALAYLANESKKEELDDFPF